MAPAETGELPSKGIRIAQICFGVLFTLLSSGLIFGYAGLKPVLVGESVYAELCRPGEREWDDETGTWTVCQDQDTRLNLVFTVAAVATSIAGFPTGVILDKLGPRGTAILGAVLMTAGNILFGLRKTEGVDTIMIGFFLIAIGGPCVCLSSFHLSSAFEEHAGKILSAVTGSFDASSLPYALYGVVHKQTGGKPNIKIFFTVYAIIPVLLIIEQILIGPKKAYQRSAAGEQQEGEDCAPEAVGTEAGALEANASAFHHSHHHDPHSSSFSRVLAIPREELGDDDEEGPSSSGPSKDALTGLMYGKTAWEQLRSRWFFLLAFFVCVHMTRVNYYIESVHDQLLFFTHDKKLADRLSTVFALMLPIGGVAGIPFVGLLLDKRPFTDVTMIAFACGLGFGILGMTSSAAAQVIQMVIFAVFRPLMYTTVSEAVAKICGFKTFGAMYGALMSTSGIIAILNGPIDIAVHTKLHGSYTLVDVVFLVLGAISSGALVIAIWRVTRERQIQLQ